MKPSTYLIAALTILLLAGVLLVMGLASRGGGSGVPLAESRPALPATVAGAPATAASRRGTQAAATSPALPLEPGVHDPVMIKEGRYYYVFYTGGMINALRSTDLIRWERNARTLPGNPNWLRTELPNNRGDLWAPDIALHRGRYLLYYSGSTFGSRNSGIGLATNRTLDPTSPNYRWEDAGLIVRSRDSDNFNAIDPNFVLDEKGEPWLSFGSFWSGIKLIKLGEDGKPDPGNKTMHAIAARAAGSTAIEAPFIIRQGKYFYLFVSWDTCCQGVRSTYRIMVGRAEKITGPYLDQNGVDMAKGGGTQLLAGDGQRLRGPGHPGLFKDGDRWLMVHHFYDGNTPSGTSRLQVRPVTFDPRDWPVLGKAINSPG